MRCYFALKALAPHRDQATLPPPRDRCDRKSRLGLRTRREGCDAGKESDSSASAVLSLWHALHQHPGEDADKPGDHAAFSMSHTEGIKGYLTKKESDGVLRQMTWPPQSPDLNPIEMV
ncbi:hypothetical protein C0J50_7917 [Silurus asotus]|uniref:Tc1-like transposase DDE domain-containing protein n=1 Tax=Silurus asotus TaxID=30991 RepID=A0AAD5B959_SILAS|nr:hypothetical protein C0J50_7917 [Silurus asotus]